jgi:YNFM family putative membrane transporter
MGSSVAGAAGGLFWSIGRWTGVIAFVGAMLLVALGIAIVGTREPRSRVPV